MATRISKLVREGKIGPIVDAKKPVFIEVTSIDVARSQKIAPDQCAMAKATCRIVGTALKAFFYENAAYIALIDPDTNKMQTLRFIPSPEARNNIATFDRTGKFAPGTYRLDAPSGSKTLVEVSKRSKKRKGRHQPANAKIKRKMKAESRGRIQYAYAY